MPPAVALQLHVLRTMQRKQVMGFDDTWHNSPRCVGVLSTVHECPELLPRPFITKRVRQKGGVWGVASSTQAKVNRGFIDTSHHTTES